MYFEKYLDRFKTKFWKLHWIKSLSTFTFVVKVMSTHGKFHMVKTLSIKFRFRSGGLFLAYNRQVCLSQWSGLAPFVEVEDEDEVEGGDKVETSATRRRRRRRTTLSNCLSVKGEMRFCILSLQSCISLPLSSSSWSPPPHPHFILFLKRWIILTIVCVCVFRGRGRDRGG